LQQSQNNEEENIPPFKECEQKKTRKVKVEKKRRCNPDIIKACEVIMKKHNHNEMKTMAKEFLKEKGYLAPEKEPIRARRATVTEPSQPLQYTPFKSENKPSWLPER
jgi:hypothetical protein